MGQRMLGASQGGLIDEQENNWETWSFISRKQANIFGINLNEQGIPLI